MTEVHQKLLAWFDANQRAMPWRRTKDPYAIWVSEVMLQQTQVSVVIPYWERWMARFPSIGSLAMASEQDVLELWQGLGYYRRAKMLLKGAQLVARQGIPTTATEWKKVPGVGDYTAGAIASIAFDEASPVVDGNVARVYSRLHADDSEPTALHRNAWNWAANSVPDTRAGDWNQALMELGATVCTPTEPRCDHCPLRYSCSAGSTGTPSQFPTKKPTVDLVKVESTLWIILNNDQILLRPAASGEWWSGMMCLPFQKAPPAEGWIEDLGRFKFSVTNHRILVDVNRMQTDQVIPGYEPISPSELAKLPIPAPHRKAIRMHQSI